MFQQERYFLLFYCMEHLQVSLAHLLPVLLHAQDAASVYWYECLVARADWLTLKTAGC